MARSSTEPASEVDSDLRKALFLGLRNPTGGWEDSMHL